MTVRCLTEIQKNAIIALYEQNTNLATLSNSYEVSIRTIGRVIEQAGLSLPVARLQGDAYMVMKVLRQYNIPPAGLKLILEDYKQLIKEKKEIKEYGQNVTQALLKQTRSIKTSLNNSTI